MLLLYLENRVNVKLIAGNFKLLKHLKNYGIKHRLRYKDKKS